MGSSSKGKKNGGYRSAGGNRKRCGSVPSRSSEETTTTVKSPDQINTNPIFKGHVEPQPLTEDIAFGTENRTVFVKPKSRRRSNASLIKQQEVVTKSKSSDFDESHVDESEFRCSKDNYIFVGNIKRTMDAKHLRDTFKRYGKVLEVNFVRRDGNSLPYAYVAFKSVATVERLKGMMDIPDVHNEGHYFRVEARKTFPTDSLRHNNKAKPQDATTEMRLSFTSMPLVSGKLKTSGRTLIKSGWKSELENFSWKACASKYLFRVVTMEDYLVEYIHTQASYLQLSHEPIQNMIHRLIEFSESKPKDLTELMPPSVSGVVYNLSREQENFLDTISRLLPVEKFRVEGNSIYYLGKLSKELAAQKLRESLVEGLFVYFFAKFCHGPTFRIKVSFYQRSEPIRTAITVVTGQNDVQEAIHTFFDFFKEIFVYDSLSGELVMRRDYFNTRSDKEDVLPFLEEPCHMHPQLAKQQANNHFQGLSLSEYPDLAQHPPSKTSTSANFWKVFPSVSEISDDPLDNNNNPTQSIGSAKSRLKQRRTLLNVCGYVSALTSNHLGEIDFRMDPEGSCSKEEEEVKVVRVGFKRRNTYVDGRRLTANHYLSDVLQLGEMVNFNAFLTSGDPSDGVSVGGHCTHVWKGQTPSFVENIINGKPIQNPHNDSNQPETKVWRKVRGKICTVLTPKSGYVKFKLDRRDLEAHFSIKDYVTKEINSELSEEVHLGRAVVIDVERQMLFRGACYRALTVRDDRSGSKEGTMPRVTTPPPRFLRAPTATANHQTTAFDQSPTRTPSVPPPLSDNALNYQTKPSTEKGDRTNESEDGGDSDISLAYSYERKLSRDLDQLLEPAEVTESICLEDAVDFEDFPSGLSLPPSVESVLQHVFGEDTHVSHGHKILSNPLAVEDVLNRMHKKLSSGERAILKLQIEKGIRKTICKFLAEKDTATSS